MGRTAKLTISLPRELIALADQIAKERKISRSRVISSCLSQMAQRQKETAMADGYLAMAKEQKQFAEMVSGIEHEVLPEWK